MRELVDSELGVSVVALDSAVDVVEETEVARVVVGPLEVGGPVVDVGRVVVGRTVVVDPVLAVRWVVVSLTVVVG